MVVLKKGEVTHRVFWRLHPPILGPSVPRLPRLPRDSVCEPQQQNDKEVGQANLGCSGNIRNAWIWVIWVVKLAMDGYGSKWRIQGNEPMCRVVSGFSGEMLRAISFFYKQVVAICLSFPGCAILLQVWGGFASLWNLATLDLKRTEYSIWNSGSARKQIWSVWTTPKSADLPSHFGLVCYAHTYDLVGNIRNPLSIVGSYTKAFHHFHG